MTNIEKNSILIIDDDNSVLSSLSMWLKSESFIVYTAVNSSEAIDVISTSSIDLVLLDYKLENETGVEVAELLIKVDEEVVIIIITGFPSFDNAVESMKKGVFDYISKGSTNEKILEAINKGLEHGQKILIDNYSDSANEPVLLTYTIFCNHTLITERLHNFSEKNKEYKLVKVFPKFSDIMKIKYLPEIDIALICSSCNIDENENYYSFFHKFYKHLPSTKAVIFNEKFNEKDKVELLKIGVKGFLSYDIDTEKLQKILEQVKNGEIWTSRKIANLALQSGVDYLKLCMEGNKSDYGLSAREKEILKAVALGLKNKEIADRLFISETTVKTHINKIFKKLKVNNRCKAILLAINEKIF